jgi:hypothetical protein
MIDPADFQVLIDEIMSQGVDAQTASRYAYLIGDCPHSDDSGNILVIDRGEVLATLKPLKFFFD